MKRLLRASARPYEKTSNELPATQQRDAAPTQGAPRVHQRADGGFIRGINWKAVSQVPIGRGQARNGISRADVRRNATGLADGADCERRPGVRRSAIDRCNDRARQAVTNAGHVSALTSSTLTIIIREALRAAALAPTYQDALDVTGDALRRLAELARAEVSRG